MVGPPKLDLMRSAAKWGRRLDALPGMRHLASPQQGRMGYARLRTDAPPGAALKQARRLRSLSRMGRYMSYTLEQIAPVWKGALRVFSPSHAAQTATRMPSRPGFVPEHYGLSSRGTRLGNFALMRARLPRGPSLAPSMRHGPGLQTARSFSSGPQGARLFENMITNAPLALRAAGCDLDKDWNRKATHATPAFAYAMKAQRWGLQCSQRALDMAAASANAAMGAWHEEPKAAVPERIQTVEEYTPSAYDLDLLFPMPVTSRPSSKLITTMHVPLEPDISNILERDQAVETYASLEDSWTASGMLDTTVRERLHAIHAAYSAHEQRLTALEQVLRGRGIWPSDLDVSAMLTSSSLRQPLVLEIAFEGWSRDEVQRMLEYHLGSCEWCSLSETRCEPDLFYGPPDAPNAELDMLDAYLYGTEQRRRRMQNAA